MLPTIVAIVVVSIALLSAVTFVFAGVRLKKLRREVRTQRELIRQFDQLRRFEYEPSARLSPELEQRVISNWQARCSNRIHQLKAQISASGTHWFAQRELRRELQTQSEVLKEVVNINERLQTKLRGESPFSPESEQPVMLAWQAATSERIRQLEGRVSTSRNLLIGSGVTSTFGFIGLSVTAIGLKTDVPRLERVEPAWNVWVEQSLETVSFRPAAYLQTQHEYSLVVNLSAIAFDRFKEHGVISQHVSSGFERWLEENPQIDSAEVKLHVYPDTEYFAPPMQKVKSLRLNLARMRRLMQTGISLGASPIEILQIERDYAEFSFGVSSFQIETLSRPGLGSIAIAIWANGRALDEISVSFCITDNKHNTCAKPETQSTTLAAIDLTSKPQSEYPDATLQLMARDNEVVGEFRCEKCGWPRDYYPSWVIPESKQWISDRFREIIQKIGKTSLSDKAFRQKLESAGDEIYNVVFHSRGPGVVEAQKGFADFILDSRAGAKHAKTARTLFAKIVTGEHELILAPIGLMRVPLANNHSEFVGFNVKVQTPLEYQDYSSPTKCISNWLFFVPPYSESPPLPLKDVLEARQAFGEELINGFKQSCPSCIVEKEEDFQHWLGGGKPENHALVILSHHKQNALYLNEVTEQPEILSSDITRDFASPSLVILDACGTSEPSASEFVRAFNYHKVDTVIATSTQVEPSMAGTFLATFVKELREHPNEKEYTVSDARFDAVRAMGEPVNSSYGPKALVFVLAGNDAVSVCLPQSEEGAKSRP